MVINRRDGIYFGSMRSHIGTVVRYYIFSKIESYVEHFEFTILLCSETLNFEILSIFVETL